MSVVALRGRLEQVTDPSSSSSSLWQWSGEWVFGTRVVTVAPAAQVPSQENEADAAAEAAAATPSDPVTTEELNVATADSAVPFERKKKTLVSTAPGSMPFEYHFGHVCLASQVPLPPHPLPAHLKEPKAAGEKPESASQATTGTTATEAAATSRATTATAAEVTATTEATAAPEATTTEATLPTGSSESISQKAPLSETKEQQHLPTFAHHHVEADGAPPSGFWHGTFCTPTVLPVTAARRNSSSTITQQPPPLPHQQVAETFVLFFQTALDSATVEDEEEEDPAEPGRRRRRRRSSASSTAAAVKPEPLPAGHVLVRGRGSNEFGHFSLHGSFDKATNIMEVQKRYLLVQTAAAAAEADQERAHTRNRHLSWKRRAALESSKRPREDLGDVGSALVVDTTSGGPPAPLRKRLPRKRGKNRLTSSSTASLLAGTTTASAAAAAAAAAASAKEVLQLPPTADPLQARWRAAHFLYYQPQEAESATASSSLHLPMNILSAAGKAVGSEDLPAAPPKLVVYEGEMLQGERDGQGICLYNNGTLYEGQWKQNKEHGRGTLFSGDRQRVLYQGEWLAGRFNGLGVYYYYTEQHKKKKLVKGANTTKGESTFVLDSRYEGEFRENLRHGNGTYYLPDGSTYQGQFRDDEFCGRGVFCWSDGSVYDGDWKDGKRHGSGVLRASDGFTYDGMWNNNAMDGRGSATYPSGQQYHGLFSNGRREGRGTVVFRDGAAVYEGRFRDDAVDGQGTMKMTRTMAVPREMQISDDLNTSADSDKPMKEDFMIPLHFQSDIGHIHRKAGFTLGGE
jgi:hypothetical protein